jgi:hypothetical protein
MGRLLFFILAFAGVGTAHADPLLHFSLEGRKFGTADAFAANLPVTTGDLIEYRIRAVLSPPITPYELIPKNNGGITLHGVNSMFLEISQDAGDGIQVDFLSPAALAPGPNRVPGDGWGAGISAGGGKLLSRPGTAFNDLTDIRPIHGPGVFTAWEWETIATGAFEVAAMSGSSAQVRARWTTNTEEWRPGIGDDRSGGFWWDGDVHFTKARTESGPDPYTDYAPLTLTASELHAVPEPSTLTLLGTIAGIFVLVRRSRAAKCPTTPSPCG